MLLVRQTMLDEAAVLAIVTAIWRLPELTPVVDDDPVPTHLAAAARIMTPIPHYS